MRILTLLTVLILALGAFAYNGRRLDMLNKEPPIPARKSVRAAVLKYITQKVDNFNPQDKREWNMVAIRNCPF
jgi:hypothetical protein